MVAAFQIKRALKKLDYQVEHIEFATTKPTRNLVTKIRIIDNFFCCKIYRDDPWGYFHLDQGRLDAKLGLLKHLSSTIAAITPPVTPFLFTDIGPCLFWQWLGCFHEGKETRPEYDQIFNERPWLYNFGKLLATIHQTSIGFRNSQYKRQQFFQSLPIFFEELTSETTEDALQNLSSQTTTRLFSLASQWLEEYDQLGITWSSDVWIHGDVHFNNIRFNKTSQNVEHFIDWDVTRQDTRLMDLIETMQRAIYFQKVPFPGYEILKGYESVTPLTEQERQIFKLVVIGGNIKRHAYMIGSGFFPDNPESLSFELNKLDEFVVNMVLKPPEA